MRKHPYKRKYIISQTFLNPNSIYSSGYHLGVDLVGLEDKAVYAIENGVVVFSDYESGFGNTVVVQQNDGLYTRYSHLDVIQITRGKNVISGITKIGIEGKTGNVVGGSDPRHLDLRISRVPYHTDTIGAYFNPCDYLGYPNKLYHIVTPEAGEMAKIKNIILCKSDVDKRAAGYLADYLRCKIIEPDLLPPSVLEEVFETIYMVGSQEKPVPKVINIFGTDRYDTCQKVINLIRSS